MREKYDGLKKLLVICAMVLVIVGLFPVGTDTQNALGMTVWAQTEAVIDEEYETMTEEFQIEEPEQEGSETRKSEVKEPEIKELELEEPETEESQTEEAQIEEQKPQLPSYTVTELTAVMFAQTDCNVRSGPSTDYGVIGYLSLNQGVNVIGRADTGWYKIDYSGMEAFVSHVLLAEKQVVIEEPEPEPQPEPESQFEPQPTVQKQRWEYTEGELIQIALAEAGVNDNMSAWDKAVAVNNYLCNLVTYDYTYTYRSTYDTLAYGTAVCQGYANAFKKMMEAAGVPTDYISGQGWNGAEWGSHGWNRVLIDGTYYYVDVTWNDGLSSDKYLMISYEQMSYDHFEQRINPYRVE